MRFLNPVVIGAGTMGADIALTLARVRRGVQLVEPDSGVRERVRARFEHIAHLIESRPDAARIVMRSGLDEVSWPAVDLVIEAIPEKLHLKRALFRDLASRTRPDSVLASNSSSFPISAIAEGIAHPGRAYGLHYFMPADVVPLVEVVCGAASEPEGAKALAEFMRETGKVPVLVRKDLPGFLANRLQHALGREALALVESGVATVEDVDAAVRFGFGFRYLAAGPLLQRDHAGLDVHAAAAATIYPTLSSATSPSRELTDRVAAGRTGIKAGAGFRDWTVESAAIERERYERILRGALDLVTDELPAPPRAP